MKTATFSFEKLLAIVRPPDGYTLDQLARADVPALIQKLAAWYPTLNSGMEGVHLHKEHYDHHARLKGEPIENKNDLALVAKKGDEIVAFFSLTFRPEARQLGRLLTVAPEHRRSGLSVLAYDVVDGIAELTQAALFWGTATLSHPITQHTLEKRGYRLCGIFPAFDLDTFAPGEARLVCEAIYCKIFAQPGELRLPERKDLVPSVQKLWDFLGFDELVQKS